LFNVFFLGSEAFSFKFDDGCVMNQPIYGSDRHDVIREYWAPLAKGLVRGDDQTATLVTVGDSNVYIGLSTFERLAASFLDRGNTYHREFLCISDEFPILFCLVL
jgi:hypothetical protein